MIHNVPLLFVSNNVLGLKIQLFPILVCPPMLSIFVNGRGISSRIYTSNSLSRSVCVEASGIAIQLIFYSMEIICRNRSGYCVSRLTMQILHCRMTFKRGKFFVGKPDNKLFYTARIYFIVF